MICDAFVRRDREKDLIVVSIDGTPPRNVAGVVGALASVVCAAGTMVMLAIMMRPASSVVDIGTNKSTKPEVIKPKWEPLTAEYIKRNVNQNWTQFKDVSLPNHVYCANADAAYDVASNTWDLSKGKCRVLVEP